jgi:hypothetical protein
LGSPRPAPRRATESARQGQPRRSATYRETARRDRGSRVRGAA